jgi:hypothetical protein
VWTVTCNKSRRRAPKARLSGRVAERLIASDLLSPHGVYAPSSVRIRPRPLYLKNDEAATEGGLGPISRVLDYFGPVAWQFAITCQVPSGPFSKPYDLATSG